MHHEERGVERVQLLRRKLDTFSQSDALNDPARRQARWTDAPRRNDLEIGTKALKLSHPVKFSSFLYHSFLKICEKNTFVICLNTTWKLI
jgi:hypothetical protein